VSKAGKPRGERRVAELPEAAIRSFEAALRGEVVLPDDERYDAARRVWNGEINRFPALVARCTGVADVVEAVNFAREQDLLVAVRGGAHNAAGNATCDGGIVIDLAEMNGVAVDPIARTVRAGGGAKWIDVDRETQVFGLAAPGGVVSDTGIAGFTLGGGYGHLRRRYGLACDNLRSATVVTADGAVRIASRDRNEDLFWALRGGGGNFGVVTSFEYDLHPVGPEVSVLFVWYPADTTNEVFRRFRAHAETAPNAASTIAFAAYVPETEEFPATARGDLAVVLAGLYADDPGDGDAEFRGLRELGEPIVDFSGRMNYTDLQTLLDADYPSGRHYYWKSVYLDELSDEVFDAVESDIEESPSKLTTIDLWGMGGAIGDVEADSTAFWHRDEPYMLNYEANWDDPAASEANVSWVRERIDALREFDGVSGGYGNFPGFNEDPVKTIFGGNYDRLVDVKTTYDPTNLFRLNQNVTPRD